VYVNTEMEILAKRRKMRKGGSIRGDIFMDEQI
jgi:hypothetical protein